MSDEVDYKSDEDVKKEGNEEGTKGKLNAVLANLKNSGDSEDGNVQNKVMGTVSGMTSGVTKDSFKNIFKRKSTPDKRKSAPQNAPPVISDSDDIFTQISNYFSTPPPPTKQSQRIKDLKAANEELKKSTFKVYETMYTDIKTQTASVNPAFAKSLKEVQDINSNMNAFQENLANLTKNLKESMPNYPTFMKIGL